MHYIRTYVRGILKLYVADIIMNFFCSSLKATPIELSDALNEPLYRVSLHIQFTYKVWDYRYLYTHSLVSTCTHIHTNKHLLTTSMNKYAEVVIFAHLMKIVFLVSHESLEIVYITAGFISASVLFCTIEILQILMKSLYHLHTQMCTI